MTVLVRFVPADLGPASLTFGTFGSFEEADQWFDNVKNHILTENQGWWHKPDVTRRAFGTNQMIIARFRHNETGLYFNVHVEMVTDAPPNIAVGKVLDLFISSYTRLNTPKK